MWRKLSQSHPTERGRLAICTSHSIDAAMILSICSYVLHALAELHAVCVQVLHYDPDSMQKKLQYLKEIGMGPEQRSLSILRLPQLLSLDVSHNMRPKYNYLRSQLGGSIRTLSEYPGYFSLSLSDR